MILPDRDEETLYFGIEAGGTKFNCVVGDIAANIVTRAKFQTKTPEETLPQVRDFFLSQRNHYKKIGALGIASFGPVDLDETSLHYGHITATPKIGWSNTDIVGYFKQALDIPIAFDTDVNGAALGERHFGAAKNIDDFIYVTVGTGIGAGVFVNGALVKGMLHTELGHMLVPIFDSLNKIKSACPFHDNCLTAFASGPAIQARWGSPAYELSSDHTAWDIEANYLAIMCMNIMMTYSPRLIILGGGIMSQQQLFPKIQERLQHLLNGYMVPEISLDHYIVPPQLAEHSGEIGALTMAIQKTSSMSANLAGGTTSLSRSKI